MIFQSRLEAKFRRREKARIIDRASEQCAQGSCRHGKELNGAIAACVNRCLRLGCKNCLSRRRLPLRTRSTQSLPAILRREQLPLTSSQPRRQVSASQSFRPTSLDWETNSGARKTEAIYDLSRKWKSNSRKSLPKSPKTVRKQTEPWSSHVSESATC